MALREAAGPAAEPRAGARSDPPAFFGSQSPPWENSGGSLLDRCQGEPGQGVGTPQGQSPTIVFLGGWSRPRE